LFLVQEGMEHSSKWLSADIAGRAPRRSSVAPARGR
jgi:hypothetical protein